MISAKFGHLFFHASQPVKLARVVGKPDSNRRVAAALKHVQTVTISAWPLIQLLSNSSCGTTNTMRLFCWINLDQRFMHVQVFGWVKRTEKKNYAGSENHSPH